jgi:hypothetical protein
MPFRSVRQRCEELESTARDQRGMKDELDAPEVLNGKSRKDGQKDRS